MTTRKDLAELACKFLAVYFLVQVVMSLGSVLIMLGPVIRFFQQKNNTISFWESMSIAGMLWPYALSLVFSVIFWCGASWIAIKMTGRHQPEVSQTSLHMSPGDFLQIGLILVGVWLFVSVMTEILTYGVSTLHAKTQLADTAQELKPWFTSTLIPRLVRLIFALFLMFGGRGLTGLLLRARTIGLKQVD